MKVRGGEFSTGTMGNFQPELTLSRWWVQFQETKLGEIRVPSDPDFLWRSSDAPNPLSESSTT